jgi:hypothetical protein
MSNIGNITFSYFDQTYNQVKENNLINILGSWSTIIIYFDQTNIPIETTPIQLNTPSNSFFRTSDNYGVIYGVSNVRGITSLSLVGVKHNPPNLKPYKFILNNNPYICLYFNGYLTQFSPDSIFSPSYYDINRNTITNNNLKNITKVVILNPSNINKVSPNMLSDFSGILSPSSNENMKCTQNINEKNRLVNLKDPCFVPNTQLTWIGNPDAKIVDYSKPHTILKLYDANNNEIVNDPANYSKVTQIAYFMSDTPGPYPPPSYIPIIIIIFILLLIGGLVYYFFLSTPDTPGKTKKGGYFLLGE